VVAVLGVLAGEYLLTSRHHDGAATSDIALHPAFGPTGTPAATRTHAADEPATSQTPFTPPPTPQQPVALPPVATAKPSPPGVLSVSAHPIALGTKGTHGTITVSNTGGQPISVTLNPAAAWLTVRPASALVAPGKSVVATVKADRSKAAEGDLTAVVAITSDRGTAGVPVTMRVEHPPVVSRPIAGAPVACTLPVSVTVTDESGVAAVRLSWSGAGGSGSADLVQQNGVWTATVTTPPGGGAMTFQARASDERGNPATGPALHRNVAPCTTP
jgi:hypothetical protein